MSWCDTLESIWRSVWDFLNSPMGTALIGGAVGSFGGAVGAQRIVEKFKERDEIVRELRNTNSAITASFMACNAALALKNQHVKPLCDAYMGDRERLEKFFRDRAAGKTAKDVPFEFVADLRSFEIPSIPIEHLRDLLFNKISATSRPLALVTTLEQVLAGLARITSKREDYVQRFARGEIASKEQHNFYFGVPFPDGTINREYRDFVEGICNYVDDAIFFSAALCTDLMQHGENLRKRLSKRAARTAPTVQDISFAQPRNQGMFPPDSKYAAYMNAFEIRKK